VVAEPVLVRVPEPEVDRRVEIYDPSSGGRVTAIEVLSPSNKLPGPARLAYRSKQRDFLAAGVNLVEIDLVRAGDWVFSVDESALPPGKRAPYMVCVFRATRGACARFICCRCGSLCRAWPFRCAGGSRRGAGPAASGG
jgi:hypothetical protein